MYMHLYHGGVFIVMSPDHAHQVVGEEVMGEGVRGGRGEEGRLVNLHQPLAELHLSLRGWSWHVRMGVAMFI